MIDKRKQRVPIKFNRTIVLVIEQRKGAQKAVKFIYRIYK